MPNYEHFKAESSVPLAPGVLLVATPSLDVDDFFQSVIYLLEYSETGAMGVVLNQPAPVSVEQVLPEWADHATDPSFAYVGGPVERESAMGLVRLHPGAQAEGINRLRGDMALIDLDADPETLVQHIDQFRLFVGYAGWSPGQLEEEVAARAWWVCDTMRTDPFSPHPEGLWQHVLGRQAGWLRLFAHYPEEAAAN